MHVEIWSYQGFDPLTEPDISGFGVEAEDGSIGKIDEATHDVRASYIVVDTGPWILGKQVMLPAGLIERVDRGEEKVYVAATKDEIKDAPELDEVIRADPDYRDRLGSYYAGRGRSRAESRADLSL
jgi:hypothetical protein